MSSYRHQPPSPTTCSALYTTLRQSVSVHRFYAAVYHNGCHTNSELDPPGAVESLLFTQSSPDEIPFLRYQTSLSLRGLNYTQRKKGWHIRNLSLLPRPKLLSSTSQLMVPIWLFALSALTAEIRIPTSSRSLVAGISYVAPVVWFLAIELSIPEVNGA